MDLLDDDDLIDLRSRARRTDPQAIVAEERSRWQEMPDANADLHAWSAPSEKAGGTCHACERTGRMRCKACERTACAGHSWIMLGVCRDCATEDRVKRWNKRPEASDNWLEGA